MRPLKYSFIALALLVSAIVWRSLPVINPGFEPSNVSFGECQRVNGPIGPEDITINQATGRAYMSSDDRLGYVSNGSLAPTSGSLWTLDLTTPDSIPVEIQAEYPPVFHPHGISLLEESGQRFLFVVNHLSTTQHQINVFELTSPDSATLVQTFEFPELTSPNDVHAVSKEMFYVTNDHYFELHTLAERLETALRLPLSNVISYDHGEVTEIISGLYLANGVIANKDNNTIYLAESLNKSVSEFQLQTNGTWERSSFYDLNVLTDNLEWHQDSIIVASHGSILDFFRYMYDDQHLAPSIVHQITPSTGSVTELYQSDGSELSASTGAAKYQEQLLIGSVFGKHFVRCAKENTLATYN